MSEATMRLRTTDTSCGRQVKQKSPWVKLMGMRVIERHEYVVKKYFRIENIRNREFLTNTHFSVRYLLVV